jgi:hypothetical protein
MPPISLLAGCSRCDSRLTVNSHPSMYVFCSLYFHNPDVRLRAFSICSVSVSLLRLHRTNLLGGRWFVLLRLTLGGFSEYRERSLKLLHVLGLR